MLFQPSQAAFHNCSPSLKHQRGVVIVVALFIVALVATMAYFMMSRLERDTRRTSLILRDTQASLHAQGSIAWALDELRNNWEKKKPNELVDRLPITSPVIDVDGFKIKSTIYDMQARFNLNNLNNTNSQNDFKRLLKIVMPKLRDEQIDEILRGIVDWIALGASANEFNQYYLELPIPYRAAHKPFVSASELRLVKGITPEIFNAIQPYITALPQPTQVNVQTADAVVIAMLSKTMMPDAAKAIETLRKEKPFVTPETFLNLDLVKNHAIESGKIVILSHYFLVETEVFVEKQRVVLYTLLERSVKENKARVNMLWQSKGIWS